MVRCAKTETLGDASCLIMFLSTVESEGGAWGKTCPKFSESETHHVSGHFVCPGTIWYHSWEFVFVDEEQRYILSDTSLDAIYIKTYSLAWEAFIWSGCISNLDPSNPLWESLSHLYLTLKMKTALINWTRWVGFGRVYSADINNIKSLIEL